MKHAHDSRIRDMMQATDDGLILYVPNAIDMAGRFYFGKCGCVFKRSDCGGKPRRTSLRAAFASFAAHRSASRAKKTKKRKA